MTVDGNRLADDVLAAAVLALPERMGDDGDSGTAPSIVGAREDTPGGRPDAERREEVAAHETYLDGARFAACAEIGARRAVDRQTGEDVLMVPDLFPEGIGKVHRTVRGPLAIPCQHHQLFGMPDRQRLEQRDVDQREDGRVGADSERKRQERDGGEAGRCAEGTQGITQVRDERLEPDEKVALARGLLLQRVVAEAASSFAPRGIGMHPVGDKLFGALGEVEGHLALDLVGDLFLTKDISEPREP